MPHPNNPPNLANLQRGLEEIIRDIRETNLIDPSAGCANRLHAIIIGIAQNVVGPPADLNLEPGPVEIMLGGGPAKAEMTAKGALELARRHFAAAHGLGEYVPSTWVINAILEASRQVFECPVDHHATYVHGRRQGYREGLGVGIAFGRKQAERVLKAAISSCVHDIGRDQLPTELHEPAPVSIAGGERLDDAYADGVKRV